MELVASDAETGGLYPSIHALLSIGACCSWSEASFEVHITVESQPGKTVDPEAAQKNGYTPERWKELGAVDLHTAMQRFDEWLKQRKEERRQMKLVCHHLAFDKGFFQEAGRMTGIEMPHRHDWRCSQLKFGELMDEGVIDRGSSSLDRLKELSGWKLPRAEAHNALQDAQMTLHGYLWLKERDKDPERVFSELASGRLQRVRQLEALLQFPRNPERDAQGNAVLYPGALSYEGVAAVFANSESGEWVILAPTAEALEAKLRLHDISDELKRDRCRVVKIEPLPTSKKEEGASHA
ncbi:exonuclease domain-containing protein [Prosthecobacter sp.]|uniref:3'-5' exonuclease n=1 Tax=Prosthecobacter sp. TaxID=1965333 RepID=UPI00378372B0